MASKGPATFGDYLKGNSKEVLISDWTAKNLVKVKKHLKVLAKHLVGKRVEPGKSNQATGNNFEKLLNQALADSKVPDFALVPPHAQGYPDCVLTSRTLDAILCMEVKSTSGWDDNDSNRRVLMSSVNRLEGVRKSFPGKHFLHLICTIEYDAKTYSVDQLQFHFINSSSPVGYREEIHTSQQSLASGAFAKYRP